MDIDFEKLIELQRIDSEIRLNQSLLEALPALVADIDRRMEESAQALRQAREKLVQNQKRRRELEGEVKEVKAQISKYKTQLHQVKTNKEYSALLKEIEDHQKKVDTLEEEIIQELLNADEVEAEIQAAAGRHAETEQKLQNEKRAAERDRKTYEDKLSSLAREKEELLLKIPPDQLSLYMKIFKKKGGVALSPIQDDFCSLCHVRIRPQMLNELLERNALILCENCGRILHWVKKRSEEEPKAASRKNV